MNGILLAMQRAMLAAEESKGAIIDAGEEVYTEVMNILTWVLGPIIAIAAVVGIIYAIVVGVKMAKADNAEAREEAKKKVVFTVIGVAVAVALMLVFLALKKWLPGLIFDNGKLKDITQQTTDPQQQQQVQNMIGLL